MAELSHMNSQGQAKMVDVSDKPVTNRRAKARASIRVNAELFQKLQENSLVKGDFAAAARIAGIQAAKRTAELIPLCHPLPLELISVEVSLEEPDMVIVETDVRARSTTGVEMEALTAAAVAALTVYDMGKAVDRGMVIKEICLLEKEGGKGGKWSHAETQRRKGNNPP
ncbi:MAG TPA: cyclic pyranopterin monophosphate synthase MoaC [bacterium]